MSDDNPQDQIDEAKSDADEDLGEMEDEAAEMEDRLEENEDIGEDVEVPDPDESDALERSDGETRNRTGDTTIFSRVLYQLSYLA